MTAPHLPRRLLLSGMLAFLLIGALPALFGVALPVWADAYGLAEGEGGALLSAYGAGALGAVVAGLLGSPGLTLQTGLLLLAVGLGLMGWTGGWGPTLAGGAVTGTGFGIVAAVVNRRFLGEFGGRGPGMVGLVNAVSGVGAIAAPLVLLLAAGGPGAVLAGMAALCAVASLLAAPETMAPPRGLPRLRQPRLALLLFVLGAVAIEVALTGFGASALIDLGVEEDRATRLVSAFFAALLASRLALYWLAARVAPERLFLAGLLGTSACAGLAALGWPAVGYVVAGGFVGVTFPPFYVWAVAMLGDDPRMGAAVLTASLSGAALGPLALRPILGALGEDGMFMVVAILAGVLALAFAGALARLRPAPA